MQMKLSKLVNKVEGFDANHDLLLLMKNLWVKLHYANIIILLHNKEKKF